MTLIWLIVWLFHGTPAVHATGDNSWFAGIMACVAVDFFLTWMSSD